MKPLHRIFTHVAPRYDLLNRILTLGFDQQWRKKAAALCVEAGARRVLDLCCGTADLALQVARAGGDGLRISAVDFSKPMLVAAERKLQARGISDKIALLHADAADLPYPDGYFDAVGIAFAFRNLTYANAGADAYLAEIHRVLAPGGRFVIVETSQPQSLLLRKAFHAYMRFWVRPFGGLVSRQRIAYRYLAQSACHFPPPREVSCKLGRAGFSRVQYKPLLGGVTGIHIASR
ncbi:ubiquinone/menaquinone biosynthesis methyltransferase [Candidatus Bipolaricaulota bacterium]